MYMHLYGYEPTPLASAAVPMWKFPPDVAGKTILRTMVTRKLESCLPQTQGIGNDRDGAKTHRRAGQHRAKQPAEDGVENPRGDGNPEQIIDERKGQVLLDVANCSAAQLSRSYDSAQVALDQYDSGAFDGYVRSGAHGDTNMGRRQGRGVVDPIACHGHDAALLAEPLDGFTFFLRSNFGFDVIDAQFSGNLGRRRTTVAR